VHKQITTFYVGKFVQVGTVCGYPNQPAFRQSRGFVERNFWNGYPEKTNAAYAMAKKMLLVQLQAYRKQYDFNGIYAIPANLYGPGDNFDSKTSHVIPALIKRCLDARDSDADKITVWGSGRATRDFLYVEDAAEALILFAEKWNSPEPMNFGSGHEISIHALANTVAHLTGFRGRIEWDKSKPDGQMMRVIDSSLARHDLGWRAKTELTEGLKETIAWYKIRRPLEKTLPAEKRPPPKLITESWRTPLV